MRWLALVLAACTHVPLSAQPSALTLNPIDVIRPL
jgi:hypothetical protein